MPLTIHTFPTNQLQDKTAQALATLIIAKMHDQKPTLLLLSGGSWLDIYEKVLPQLQGSDLSSLIISLLDERFVKSDSPDSNGYQLTQRGISSEFELLGATYLPWLDKDSVTLAKAASQVNKHFEQLFKTHTLIATAGIGEDGHTAGILPTSDRQILNRTFDRKKLVTGYEIPHSDNPFRQRLTVTAGVFEKIDQIIAYAAGDKKKWAIEKLSTASTADRCDIPAVLLKQTQTQLWTDIKL